MKKRPTSIIFAMLLGMLFVHNARSQIVMSLPNMKWALEINTDGFEVQSLDTAPTGEGMRLVAENKKTGIFMTVFVEKAASEGDEKVCREHYWSQAKKSPFKKSDIKMTETGDRAKVSYLVKEFQGQEVNQKNMNAYLSESGYWVDIHLSKVNSSPKDDPLFDKVLKGVKVNKSYKPTSMMCFFFGNLYFEQQEFKSAIPHYERAFLLEKQKPTLEKELWIMLADQLGISYGMSGDIEKSRKLYQYAIKKQPTAPMLYYNYACACAEGDDLDKAILNLELAYKHKANMLPGRELHDPMKDSSFQKYSTEEKFIKAVKKMKN